MKKKVVPNLRQEVKVKVDIVTSDDIKICYTGKFQYFRARYIINDIYMHFNTSTTCSFFTNLINKVCNKETNE